MEFNGKQHPDPQRSKAGTLLFVADFFKGSREVLDFACELAERQGYDLQLLHVIDPDHTKSSPDGEMGTQFSLEMLTQRARTLTKCAVGLLSFGCPESVIPKKAAEVNASLVVLPLIGTESDSLQKRLIRRLSGKCSCPVLGVRRDLFLDSDADSISIRRLLSLAYGGDRASIGRLARASHKVRSQRSLLIIQEPAYSLKM